MKGTNRMKEWKKQAAAALAVSLAAAMPGTALAAEAAEAPETEDQAAEVAQMKEEIAALTARLSALEKQLDEAQKAGKADDKSKEEKKKGASELQWSGSTKMGYMYNQDKKGSVKSEIRLKAKTKVDDTYDVAFGLKFKSTSEEPVPATVDPNDPKHVRDGHASEKNKVKLDEASIGRAFGPVYLKAGVQSATVGEGLWIGKSSLNIFSGKYDMTPRDSLFVGYGRDSQDYLAENEKTQSRLLKFVDYQHHFGSDAMAGIYLGAQQPDRYLGVYGETPLIGKLSLAGEFVHNTNTDKPDENHNHYGYVYRGSKSDTDGYFLSLAYGQAKKKGDFRAAVNYFNVDQNLFMDDGYTAFDDYVTNDGLLGFGHTKLSLERYWAHTKPVAGNVDRDGNELPESPYYTTYVKFTSKF